MGSAAPANANVEPCSDLWRELYPGPNQNALSLGYITINGTTSEAAGRLRDQIFDNFGPWYDPNSNINFWANKTDRDLFAFQRIYRHGAWYGKLGLFEQLPALLWQRINGSTTGLALELGGARETDRALRRGSGADDIRWENLPVSWSQQLATWLGELANIALNPSFLLGPVVALLQVGFYAFLRLAGIDPSQFQMAWSQFTAVLTDAVQVLGDIAADPLGYARTLIDGGLQGVQEFFGNFLSELQGAAFDWLFGNLQRMLATTPGLPPLPTQFSIGEITLFLLGLAGLPTTLSGALSWLGISGPAVNTSLQVLTLLLGDPPSVQRVQNTLQTFSQTETNSDLQLSFSNLFDWVQMDLPPRVANWATQVVATQLPALVFPGSAALLSPFPPPPAASRRGCDQVAATTVARWQSRHGSEVGHRRCHGCVRRAEPKSNWALHLSRSRLCQP